MGADDKQPDSIGAVALQGLFHRYQVAQGLAHFILTKLQQPIVQPVFGKGGNPGEAFRLGYLILVMREDKVLPTTMNVKAFTEIFQRHSAALYMPSRPALAPGAWPKRLAWLGCLPYGEVQRIFFLALFSRTSR